jgi:hypothetical protein
MAAEPLTAAVLHDALARLEGRIGKRFDHVEEPLALRTEITDLKERVDTLQDRIRTLEERLPH